jgi:hypothetical protein
LAGIAIGLIIMAAIYDTAYARKLRKKLRLTEDELNGLKQIAWIRGAKGRFERLVPKKEEIVPGVTSEHANPVVGG